MWPYPFWEVHLMQMSGILVWKWSNLTGAIYSPVSHCTVIIWNLCWQIEYESKLNPLTTSGFQLSPRSVTYTSRMLFEDLLCLSKNIENRIDTCPLSFKRFIVMSSNKDKEDRSRLFCCWDKMKLRSPNQKISVKMFCRNAKHFWNKTSTCFEVFQMI